MKTQNITVRTGPTPIQPVTRVVVAYAKGKPIQIEVCERLCDHHHIPYFKDGQFVRMVEAPKYHAFLAGNTGVWAAGTSRYEAIGDLILHHPEVFGIEVTELPKQAR